MSTNKHLRPKPLGKEALVALITEILELTDKDHHGLSQKARIIYDTIIRSMTEALLRGEQVHVKGFGILRVRERKAHKGRITFPNPYTKPPFPSAVVLKPAKKVIKFFPSVSTIEVLNEPQP